jgi:hypothetical protein
MFDFRYHALSLAAIFIALVVGLLLGAAIGARGPYGIGPGAQSLPTSTLPTGVASGK